MRSLAKGERYKINKYAVCQALRRKRKQDKRTESAGQGEKGSQAGEELYKTGTASTVYPTTKCSRDMGHTPS